AGVCAGRAPGVGGGARLPVCWRGTGAAGERGPPPPRRATPSRRAGAAHRALAMLAHFLPSRDLRMAPALPTARPAEIGLSEAGLRRLSAAFTREIESKRLPGMVALLARRGRIGFVESLGVRDPKSGGELAADAVVRIGCQ